jgi:hypothetical protein
MHHLDLGCSSLAQRVLLVFVSSTFSGTSRVAESSERTFCRDMNGTLYICCLLFLKVLQHCSNDT